jgi:hypothetical protein
MSLVIWFQSNKWRIHRCADSLLSWPTCPPDIRPKLCYGLPHVIQCFTHTQLVTFQHMIGLSPSLTWLMKLACREATPMSSVSDACAPLNFSRA